MPKFLEDKLKREYRENSAVPFKVMNKLGAMRGNKETAQGREMEEKHEADMKAPKAPKIRSMRIEIHRGPKNAVTGHTVHHEMMPTKTSPSAAFMEETHHSFPFDAKGQSSTHGDMMDHIADHLGMGGAESASKGSDIGQEEEEGEE